MKTLPHRPTRLMLAASLLCASASALAQSAGSPWYLGASYQHTWADNVFRENSSKNNDQLNTINLLGGVDTRLGRQRVYGGVKLTDNRYQDNSYLNNKGFQARGAMDWATAGDLSGNFTYIRNRMMADFNSSGDVTPSTDLNMQTDQSAEATARLGLPGVTNWDLSAGYVYRTRDYSLASYQSLEYRQNATSLGVNYMPSSLWRFGVAGRYTKGHSSDGTYDYTRKDIDLTANWNATGASSVNARISRSRADTFNGVTGALIWDWRPGGRFSMTTQVSRDTGVETYYLGVANVVSDYNRVTTSAQTQATYRLTGKVNLTAGLGYSKVSRDDKTYNTGYADSSTSYNAGVSWAATRAVTLGCGYNAQHRNSYSVLYTYDASSVSCYVQGIIQ